MLVNTDMLGRTASGSAASQSNGSHEELFEGEKKTKKKKTKTKNKRQKKRNVHKTINVKIRPNGPCKRAKGVLRPEMASLLETSCTLFLR